jgi:hypothetical protein
MARGFSCEIISPECEREEFSRDRGINHPFLATYHHHRIFSMSYPSVDSHDSYLQALQDLDDNIPGAREAVLAVQADTSVQLGRLVPIARVSAPPPPQVLPPPPTPSVDPPKLSSSQAEAGTSNYPVAFKLFCTGTPVSQPITPNPEPTGTSSGKGQVGMTPRAKGRPLTQRALPAADKLSVFDIHNIFHCRWFLSWDHLVANVILAQKAKDGKIFWVEFTPQFHAHLVKCAVVLVPHPINKVKKVMFGFILELLNGEGPQAFFDLTKGQWAATLALKEKRRLAWKRNHATRQASRKAMADMANGKPQWSCKHCKCKFASCRATKRHRCPFFKGESDESGEEIGKGKARANPKPNKPVPKTQDAPPAPPIGTTTSALTQAAKTQDQVPSKKKKKSSSTTKKLQKPKTTTTTPGPRDDVATHFPHHTYGRELASNQPFESTSDCHSLRLNTEVKRNIRRGLLDKLHK